MKDIGNYQNSVGVDRTKKVASVLRRELSAILHKDMADPRIGMITITDVEVSRDLKQANVYMINTDSQDNLHDSLKVLNRAKSYIRRLLGTRLSMKSTPEIRFIADDLPDRGARVMSLIDSVTTTSG